MRTFFSIFLRSLASCSSLLAYSRAEDLVVPFPLAPLDLVPLDFELLDFELLDFDRLLEVVRLPI